MAGRRVFLSNAVLEAKHIGASFQACNAFSSQASGCYSRNPCDVNLYADLTSLLIRSGL